jgi:hypothetical protein
VVLCFCYPWRLSPGHPDTAALKQIKRSAVWMPAVEVVFAVLGATPSLFTGGVKKNRASTRPRYFGWSAIISLGLEKSEPNTFL